MKILYAVALVLLLYNLKGFSCDQRDLTYATNVREKMLERIHKLIIPTPYFAFDAKSTYIKAVEVTTLAQQNTLQNGGVVLEQGDSWDDYCIVVQFNDTLARKSALFFPMHFMSLRVLYHLNTSDIPAFQTKTCLRPVVDQVRCRDGTLASFGGPNCMPMCGDKYNCPDDIMRCPDGGWISRDGPNCQFECPSSSELVGRISEEQAKIAARKLQADIYFANTGAVGVKVQQIGTIAKRIVQASLDNIPWLETESVADYALYVWCYGWCSLNAPNPIFVYENIRVFYNVQLGLGGQIEEFYCPANSYDGCTIESNCTKICTKRQTEKPSQWNQYGICYNVGDYCNIYENTNVCGYGSYCEWDTATCKKKFKSGEVCANNFMYDSCESDYEKCLPKVVHWGETQVYQTFEEVFTCQPLHYKWPGETCKADFECLFGQTTYYYNTNNSTCVDGRCYGRREGETCSPSSAECLPGLYCGYLRKDGKYLCHKLKPAGDNCSESYECENGACVFTDLYKRQGYCQSLYTGEVGTYCENDAYCMPDLKCDTTNNHSPHCIEPEFKCAADCRTCNHNNECLIKKSTYDAYKNCMKVERENGCLSQTYCRNCSKEFMALQIRGVSSGYAKNYCDIMSRSDYSHLFDYKKSTSAPTRQPYVPPSSPTQNPNYLPPKPKPKFQGSNKALPMLVTLVIVVAILGSLVGVLLFVYLYKTDPQWRQILRFGKVELGVVPYEKLKVLKEMPQ